MQPKKKRKEKKNEKKPLNVTFQDFDRGFYNINLVIFAN